MEIIRTTSDANEAYSPSVATMARIPVLHEMGDRAARKPILQLKELEPDWQRYNSWRASLIESYSTWLRRWKRLRLNDRH